MHERKTAAGPAVAPKGNERAFCLDTVHEAMQTL